MPNVTALSAARAGSSPKPGSSMPTRLPVIQRILIVRYGNMAAAATPAAVIRPMPAFA